MAVYIVLPHQRISYGLCFLINKLRTLDKVMWWDHPRLNVLIL